jgi:hypothetical protein
MPSRTRFSGSISGLNAALRLAKDADALMTVLWTALSAK